MATTVLKMLEGLMKQADLKDYGRGGNKLCAQLKEGRVPMLVQTQDGDQLVHYACQHGWLDFVKFLVEEHDCSPHSEGRNYLTPLFYACRYGYFDIVHYLISEAHCDPDCCDHAMWTPLHYISAADRSRTLEEVLKIMKFLLSLGKCDVNKRDKDGSTAFLVACRYQCYELACCLFTEGHCDIIQCDNRGYTALHLVGCSRLAGFVGDMAKLLLNEASVDLNARNHNGDTPLHLASWKENSTLVQLLLRDERCNPHEKNDKGDTALHTAYRHNEADDISKILLEVTDIDPNAKNNAGDTPLQLACKRKKSTLVQVLVKDERCNLYEKNRSGEVPQLLHWACKHQDEELVQLLVRNKRCNPNEIDSEGDTALHVACRHCVYRWGGIEIIKYVLEDATIDPNAKNKDGLRPLDLTSDPAVIRELIRHGANPQHVYKTHGEVLGTNSSKQPLQTPMKLFMVGNPSAGKSTLTKALQNEAFGLNRIKKRVMKVSGVDEKTAGIVPHEFESKTYGRVTLYDFAGQSEFYGSHAALLQNSIRVAPPIFLLVINLSKTKEEIKHSIFFWLSFLENQCTSVSSKPHFIVIGSHVDILKSKGEDWKYKASFITSLLSAAQFPSLEFSGFVAMDCQYADSAGMTELHHALKASCSSLRAQKNINFNAHCFLVYLVDKFRENAAVTIDQIQREILIDDVASNGEHITYYLPHTSTAIANVCDQLNDMGHFLVLKNPTTIENSWIVINQSALLAEVNGTIFAPEGFKEHIKLASSTGVVPLSNIAKHYLNHDLTMLTGFLSHLEFCHEILDTEVLALISQEQASEATCTQKERYFFFPGLVTLKVPSTVWEPQPHYDYNCGWILQCSKPEHFFGPRFVQVLLLRLAFSFAFTQEAYHIKEDIPALQRKCSVWSNGIYWGDIHGIETLVEIMEQNRVVVVMRCSEIKSECLQLRSLLIQKVLAAVREFCSKITTIESFINPSDTTQYPLKPTSQLTFFSIENIASVVCKGVQSASVLDNTGRPFPLGSLLSFEPYADLGEPILREIFAEGKRRKLKLFAIAECIPDKNTEMIKKIFKPSPTQLRERMSEASIASPVYHMLDIWRASCQGTYHCLREKLDQFSIFAGRNPLKIAYESNSKPTKLEIVEECEESHHSALETDDGSGCVEGD